MKIFWAASQFVFERRSYRLVGILAFVLFFTTYLFVLPATYTGGYVGWISLQYLTWSEGIIAFVLALLMGLLVPFIIFSYRMGGGTRKASTAGGLLASLITPFLCCTPVIPSVMAVIAGILPAVSGSAGLYIQAFIATHELEIYLAAILLLILALYQNARQVLRCPGCKI